MICFTSTLSIKSTQKKRVVDMPNSNIWRICVLTTRCPVDGVPSSLAHIGSILVGRVEAVVRVGAHIDAGVVRVRVDNLTVHGCFVFKER